MRKIIVTVCIKENDKLLMVQEAQQKAYKLWNFPAGHLEDREDVFIDAIREAKEETGFDVELVSLISIQNYLKKDEEILRINFNAKIISGEISFDKNEILDVKWIPISELENMTDEEIRGTSTILDIVKDIKTNKEYPLEIIKNII